MNKEEEYKIALSQFLACKSDQVFLYWKGRVALYAALKAMGIGKGDEVILPAFTCVVVPNAILYLGATPVYVDVDRKSLNTNLERIKSVVTERTKCILIQNTFGLSSEVDEIAAYGKERGIFTIEDCTHGFGGTYHGKPNGSRSDCSFYSSQWNKPFSTGVGGILLVNNRELLNEIQNVNTSLLHPGLKSRFMLRILIFLYKYLITDRTYWFLVKFYRLLSKVGLVIGSSSNDEITSTKMPADFFMAGSEVQAKEGVKALEKLNLLLDQRKRNAEMYTAFLKQHGKYHVDEALNKDHSFLKYPFLVKDREAFMLKAEKASIRLGEWFVSPLHPVETNFEAWGLITANFPNAVELSAHMLNLPTETKNPEKIIKFLMDNLEDLG